jgi:N-acetylneuraminic acid mutarotase
MAAAAVRECIYFFGGVGAGGTESILDVSDELWKFDTHYLRWIKLDRRVPWPAPRRCAGWTAHGGEILLWGGSGIAIKPDGSPQYNFLNDFWKFDTHLEEWEMLRDSDDFRETPFVTDSTVFPFPRYTPVFQSIGSDQFLFGGYTEDRLGKRKLNDAWIRHEKRWTQVPFKGRQGYTAETEWPGLRYGSMSTADLSSVYVCGGFSDDGDHIDLWRFDSASKEWLQLAPDATASLDYPHPRYCAAFSIYRDGLFLFGGRSRKDAKLNFNDLWRFDLKQREWSRIHDNRPLHRYDAGANYPGYHAKSSVAVVGSGWYIWGGEGIQGHVSDFWRFDFESLEWQFIQAAREDDPVFW